MIGKFVVIDTLDNFKSKLSSIPSSAIVLIKDVGQIYAHGTYFGARNTCELLNQEAAGLAPAGGINANGQISNVDSEWVLTVTEGKDPAWKKLPANAFANNSEGLKAATTSDLGGIKVGSVYNGLFSTLTGKHYTVNIDSDGLAYVSVPWSFTDQNVKQTVTSLLNEDFRLLFSHTADDITRTEGTRKASNLKFNPSTGTLTTTILKGNLDGNYINKLTGYSIAKSAAAITTSDTLNTALGKLEYKADVVYDLVDASKPDSTTIDTLREVLNVLSGITDTQTIQGILGNYLPLTGGTLTSTDYNILTIKRDVTANVGIAINFINKNGAACDLMADPVLHSFKRGYDLHTYKIWDEGNDGSDSGLDADLLDGKHLKSIMYVGDENVWDTQSGNRIIPFSSNSTPLSSNTMYGSVLQWTAYVDSTPGVSNNSWYYQLWGCTSYSRPLFRSRTNTGDWSALEQLSFLSDLDDYLPLTGGTISGSLTIQASSPAVTFKKSNASNPFASLGIYSDKLAMYVNSDNKYYDIIHSGNIGSQSVSYANSAGMLSAGSLSDANTATYTDRALRWFSAIPSTVSNLPTVTGWQNGLLALPLHSNGVTAQLYFSATKKIYYRSIAASDYDWNEIAYVTDNVASATKLQTARSLWGNSFDGSSDLSGDIIISKTTNSSVSGGKITLRGYYSAESANWDAIIASDYYGANYCSEAGFSHGMIFKGGRSGFDSFIFIDSSSNPVARISKVFSNYFKNNTEIEGTLSVTGNITMSSGIATNWSDTSVDSNNKARPWYGLSYSDVTNANNMMLSGYYGITYRTGSTAMNHVFKGGHVRPDTNSTQTLGTSSYKWNNVYSTTFTGNLDGNITKGTPQLCSAVESDEITIKENSNGVISTNKPNDGAALRKAINFRWYDTNWQIGNIRGSASNSGGFGITYGNNNLCFRVTTDGCYANGSKVLTEANANLGNADTVDNYHIVVTSSPGTNTSTIYFVT